MDIGYKTGIVQGPLEMTDQTKTKIKKSWKNRDGNVNSTKEILSWIKELNATTCVKIEECGLQECTSWLYYGEQGRVLNRNGKFFSITGMRWVIDGVNAAEQPIIIQPEIGYLGILCAEIEGEINFLMQAKIEPGNINCVQISPTIQATRSNYLRAHGGRIPVYYELFSRPSRCTVIYDRVQSEQGSRFLKKRNRNIILLLDEDAVNDLEIYPNFKWMTLGQIKELMKEDNLVNMDTRTVLSGVPLEEDDSYGYIGNLYQKLNDYKMDHIIRTEEIPLYELSDWTVSGRGVDCKKQSDFIVRYYNIEIEGREVRKWNQPLFKAAGMATFGLISRVHGGRIEYLIRLKPEIGCFDMAEMGPSVQWEPTNDASGDTKVDKLFRNKIASKDGIITDVILSEEGGRFYHEQNRNLIIKIEENELPDIPDDYAWADLASLSRMIRTGSDLNIQLRNLVSLIDL